MNYDKKEIFNIFKEAPLYKGMVLEEENSDEIFFSLENIKENFFYTGGASKLVFIPKDESKDFVIKIPYTGRYYKKYTDIGVEYCYRKYCYAENQERPWDYCLTEALRYKIALSHGLGKCFAKTEYLGDINGYPIYVQEKCNVFSDIKNITSHTKEAHDITLKSSGFDYNNFIDIDIDWLTDFRLYYGNPLLYRFTQFIIENDWGDDLSKYNIGYINDRPVLIDYSGFFD